MFSVLNIVGRTIARSPVSLCRNSFKSAISLDKLYPNSIEVKSFIPPTDPAGNFTGYIPIEGLDITYSRSSGPGRQHVNTTNSKVDVRFHVQSAEWLKQEVKDKMQELLKTKINKDGFLIIKSDKTRSKQLNLADAMDKLRTLVWNVIQSNKEVVISEETEEMLRKRREKNNRLRLIEKRERSLTKAQRQSPLE